MNRAVSSLASFHLIGDRSRLPVGETDQRTLQPALYANYRDLTKLRYDFPLVLINSKTDPGTDQNTDWVRSLADIIDASLQAVAPQGAAGEEIRLQVLSQEQEIRKLKNLGQTGSLSGLWQEASGQLLSRSGTTPQTNLEDNLARAFRELACDGELIDCDSNLPARLIEHAWQQSQQIRAVRLYRRIDELLRKLSDILRINYLQSSEARDAGNLQSSLGSDNQKVFDFQAMAQILRSAPLGQPLPENRERRIKESISVLKNQEFVAADGACTSFKFEFENCEAALLVFRQRLPAMAALVKAISIAELEIENRYDEAQHDAFYERFNENQLGPDDLSLFPAYLVELDNGDDPANEQAVLQLLRSGLPFKIVARTDNIVGDLDTASGQLSFGTGGRQLASMAMGLGNVFVLQSAAASLYRLQAQVMQGLASDIPALFSTYAGNGSSAETTNTVPVYLQSAAATESRAFPCFVYDPAHGETLASRFRLDANPAIADKWCRHHIRYEDVEHNKIDEETTFTLLDFLAGDGRFGKHFAPVSKADWDRNMVPVDVFLELDTSTRAGKLPYVLLIDENRILHRAVCDDRVIDAAERCLRQWRTLQETAGIDNSYALRVLDEARKAWEIEKQQLLAQASASAVSEAVTTAPAVVLNNSVQETQPTTVGVEPGSELPAETKPVEAPAAVTDDPWIETIRCTTCNECTELNDRMFHYDEDKRAYIADPDAGTYRELVEAAETCQVAIIHPGKPRNPEEPGMDELLERAAPFMT